MNRLRLLITGIVLATFLITPTQPLAAALATAQGAIDVALQPSLNPAASAGINQPPRIAPGVVLVGLKPGVTAGTGVMGAQATDASLSAAFASLGVQSVDPVFPQLTESSSVVSTAALNDLSHVYRLRLPPDADILRAVEALRANPAVAYAEPDYIAHVVATPDDTLYAGQWGLTQINAPAAWDVVTGTTSVVIAVIDSGLDTTHPDLAGQLWVNPGEIAGNGVDDDNDGYVDDVNGANIYAHNTDLADSTGHGTEVAGVIAVATNNGAGIAGVCWQCRLMVVKVTQPGGISNYSDIAAGVAYAAQKGAKVINLSLGGSTDSTTLRSAIAAAAQTAVVVGGAGNNNSSALFYPAAYDDALAVAGTTSADAKVGTSNYGTWVDVSAPGEAITTTFSGGGYGSASGTSMAAPFASGLAGLLRSQHPDWSPAQVRAHIVRTAEDIDGLNPGYEGQLGSGRINAGSAVTLPAQPRLTVASYTANGQPGGRPDPGTTVDLYVTLYNDWGSATNLQATLTTTNPNIAVLTGATSYGGLSTYASGENATPLRFSIAAGAGYNADLGLTLHMTADGGYAADLPLNVSTATGISWVHGTLYDTNWTNDHTYVVDNNIGVAAGYTLTIQPGTTVLFAGNYSFSIAGTLIADGTPEQPIHFTRQGASGTWGQIDFLDTSTPAAYDGSGNYIGGSILRHTIVEYGQGIHFNYGAAPFIASNTFTNDTAGTSGQAGGGLRIIGNTFLGIGLQIDAAEIIAGNIVHKAPGTGINAGGVMTITANRVTDSGGAGIYVLGATYVSHNLVANNGGDGLQLNGGGITPVVVSNTVVFNRGAGIFVTGSNMTPVVHGNNIVGSTGQYALNNSQTGAVDAAGNWWGTTSVPAIQAAIYDGADTFGYGMVTYSGYRSDAVADAPAYVRDVAVQPDTTLGIQTGTFDLTFSAPMDQSLNPSVAFYTAKRGTWTQYNTSNSGLPVNGFVRVAIDAIGDKWFGTNGGVARFNGATWTVYNPANSGLPDNDVMSIAFDSAGAAWFGTGGGGAARLTGTTWTIFNTSNSGLPGNDVYDIAVESPASIWFATGGGGVAHFNGAQWTIYNMSNSDLPSNAVTSIAVDNQGVEWFGTERAGVARFDGTTWSVYNSSNSGLPCDTVSDIAVDSDGAEWFATKGVCSVSTMYGQGVARFDGTTWTVYNVSNSGLPSNEVYAIAIDRNGAKWFGTDNGVARFDGSTWIICNSGLPDNRAWSIAVDQENSKWIGTFSAGVSVLWEGNDHPIGDNAQWLDPTHWRGTYDITSLVPRDTYSITVSGAKGADGMEIPADTRFGFTVDYAGQITDQTPPHAPFVLANGKAGDPSYVEGMWSASDPDSSIIGYRYAIGSAAGATDIVNWTTTPATGITRNGLGLIDGQQYWMAVQAQNVGGLWSISSYSSFVAGQQSPRIYLPLVMR